MKDELAVTSSLLPKLLNHAYLQNKVENVEGKHKIFSDSIKWSATKHEKPKIKTTGHSILSLCSAL